MKDELRGWINCQCSKDKPIQINWRASSFSWILGQFLAGFLFSPFLNDMTFRNYSYAGDLPFRANTCSFVLQLSSWLKFFKDTLHIIARYDMFSANILLWIIFFVQKYNILPFKLCFVGICCRKTVFVPNNKVHKEKLCLDTTMDHSSS